MRIILLFLLSFLYQASAFAQPTSKLRAIGLGLQGELGYTYPASSNGGMQSVFTLNARGFSNTWVDRHFVPAERLVKSHSYGFSLFYTASTRKFNLITIEGGMKQTKLVYYHALDLPINLSSGQTDYFHDWFYLNQGFIDLVLSLHLDKRRSLFLYTKLGGTYSQVGENVNPFVDIAHDGIFESGTQLNASLNDQTLLVTDEVATKGQLGLLGGLGLHINLGAARQHTFFGGLNFHYSLGRFVESSYTWKEDVTTMINTRKNYKGSYFMYEFGYRIPIVRYRGPKTQQFTKTPKMPRAPKKQKSSVAKIKTTKDKKIAYLTIAIEPSNIITAWRVPGGQWNKKTASIPLMAGIYDIQFKTIAGYSAPFGMQVAVAIGNNHYTATYTENKPISRPEPLASGSLKVIIEPFGANAAGAEWRITGGKWKDSNETLRGLAAGNYLIEYKAVKGFATPSNRSINIGTSLTSVNSIYTKISNDSPECKMLKEQMNSCFKEGKEQAKYYENDLIITGNNAKIKFFADAKDGDQISICLDGKLIVDKAEISDKGKKIAIDLKGKKEAILIIYAHNTSSDAMNNIEMQVIEGSVSGEGAKGQEIAIQMEKKEYFWIKVTSRK